MEQFVTNDRRPTLIDINLSRYTRTSLNFLSKNAYFPRSGSDLYEKNESGIFDASFQEFVRILEIPDFPQLLLSASVVFAELMVDVA